MLHAPVQVGEGASRMVLRLAATFLHLKAVTSLLFITFMVLRTKLTPDKECVLYLIQCALLRENDIIFNFVLDMFFTIITQGRRKKRSF